MSRKGAAQLAKNISHKLPKVGTMTYKPFEGKLGYAVQVSYGGKPDFVTCLSPKDWKDSEESVKGIYK
jgi:hypothetical protein